jgi:hypothetical protein
MSPSRVGAGPTAFNDVDFGYETGTFNPTLSFAGGNAQVLQAPGSGTSGITSPLPSP